MIDYEATAKCLVSMPPKAQQAMLRELVEACFETAARTAEQLPKKKGYTAARILGAIAYAAADIRAKAKDMGQ